MGSRSLFLTEAVVAVLLVGASAALAQPNIFLEFSDGSNYIEPPGIQLVSINVCVENLEPGQGLEGVALRVERTFTAMLMTVTPRPGWLYQGDVEGEGVAFGGPCAMPDPDGVVVVGTIDYFLTGTAPGALEVEPHVTEGGVVVDCGMVHIDWCVRLDPSGNLGIWMPPPPGDCPPPRTLWHVDWQNVSGIEDGSPAHPFNTITEGLDAAAHGDTVLVAAGTYSPDREASFPIDMKSGVVLVSEAGAEATIIDAEQQNRVMNCVDVDASTIVDGFTLTGGSANTGGGMLIEGEAYPAPLITNVIFAENSAYEGGGMYTSWYCDATVSNCTFTGNTAAGSGGGLSVDLYMPELADCVFEGNTAAEHGGGMMIYIFPLRDEEPQSRVPSGCTFVGNSAGLSGGAVYVASTSYGTALDNTIMAFNTGGGAADCFATSSIDLDCCDVYGNVGGDYVGGIAGQNGVDGNFSEDPRFCEEGSPNDPYSLQADSPCAAENNPGCGRIGARDVGCLSRHTWHVDWQNVSGIEGGSPAHPFNTITEGLDAAAQGDTVLVAPGTYSPDREASFPIEMKSGVVLVSEAGAEATIIDAEQQDRVMNCVDVDDSTVVDGFTLTGGSANTGGGMLIEGEQYPAPLITNVIFADNSAYEGGGMYTSWYCDATVSNCVFTGNTAAGSGGGLSVDLYAPELTDCIFEGNTAAEYGGGMMVYIFPLRDEEPPTRIPGGLTFVGNSAGLSGGAVYVASTHYGTAFDNTIMAFNTGGGAADCFATSSIDLDCCDVYGNVGGDYVGGIAGQNGIDGNFSEDPRFCEEGNSADPYTLADDSPCAAENNPGCGRVGARGVGCPSAAGPTVFLEFDNGTNYAEPPIYTPFNVNVFVENLEVGQGLRGVAFRFDRTFDGILMLHAPRPGWFQVGDVDGDGTAFAGPCVMPDENGVVYIGQIVYLALSLTPGVVEIGPHLIEGNILEDCDLAVSTWCVRTDPSGNGGLRMAPPPGNCLGSAPDIYVTPESLSFEIAGEPTACEPLTIANTGTSGLSWSLGHAASARGAGGPDGFGYYWIDSDDVNGPVFDWQEISGTGTLLELGSNEYAEVPLPLMFPFYGVAQSSVKVSSNGYLSFGPDATSGSNTSIPNPALPNDLIAPFWDALWPELSGDIYYYHDVGQNVFIVQYTDMSTFDDPPGNHTFEVILRPDGTMLFQYLDLYGDTTGSTIGIENADGTDGLEIQYGGAGYLHEDMAIMIGRDPCTWLTESPRGGVVPRGDVQNVDVCVDATGLDPGEYECDLVVTSDDPDESEVVVPVTLTVVWTGVEEGEDFPRELALRGNYPNPFNPTTSIAYDLPRSAHVTLTVHDLAGRVVRTLLDETIADPGRHAVVWDGRDHDGHRVASGVYFYRLEAEGETLTRKMIMVK